MKGLIDELKKSYMNWLNEQTKITEIDGALEITSPLMDRHNDFLQFYVITNDNNKLHLTDDGYILNDLMSAGCDFKSKRRKDLLNTILAGYGVKLSEDNELISEASINNFPQKKHLFLQAMLAVNDMFMTSQTNVHNMFFEDVENFFLENNIRFSEQINLTGKSGLTHKFDFLIPRSKSRPERLISTVNSPTIDKAKSLLFAWGDSKDTRKEGTLMYTFLNDSTKTVKSDIILAFKEYDIKPVLWSNRNDVIEELSA
ncbi:hypothetical protein PM3016_1434 [Paenibacillus mucilaginosus 3016]|uniref:DUF1828 domain-containing protein n=1 Tax=Paenibacillus mucilaginosus 3016 TaxID=1116391 RepID=H6NEQ5_9BACL|nr:DUF1829 domain-containing protein [Paenibacillus mucilaginosus]AFC28359.1 hypothetical protein PM3016_1434 [Paenibacillus mucilaginosus 3016]WFA17160.1 DUF1829 domain-containing protein [Paenibacillus mucilaginosus]